MSCRDERTIPMVALNGTMAATLDEFETAVRETTASTTRTTPNRFDWALAESIIEPAVGARLPFEEVSLADANAPVGLDPTREELLTATTGVTGATLGIASYGSVVLRMTPDVDELAALFPERHVVVVRECDVVSDMTMAFAQLAPLFEDESADAIIATGPSATADMGELVYGAHGPREVHVIILEEA